MRAEFEVKGLPVNDTGGSVHKPESYTQESGSRRAWTIKGIQKETVEQSRKAAHTQGMLLSLWVEKQLRDAAERELKGNGSKELAAEILCTKLDNIETALIEYLKGQDKSITNLQEEMRMLTNKIVPPLLEALSSRVSKKRA